MDRFDRSGSSELLGHPFEQGVRAYQRGDYGRAYACFREALDDDPGDENCRKNMVKALIQAGIQDFQGGRFEDAVGRFSAALQHDPSSEGTRTKLGKAHLRYAQTLTDSEDSELAEYHFLQALERIDDPLPVHLLLAHHLIRNQQFSKAYERLKIAREAWPEDPNILPRLAECALQHANLSIKDKAFIKAEASLKIAGHHYLELARPSFDVERGFGLVYFHTGRLEQAADAFRSALEIKPEHPRTRRDLALTLLHLGGQYAEDSPDRAEDQYRAALELKALATPERVSGLVNLGVLHFNRKAFQRAMAPFRAALELDTTHAQARDYLIRVHVVLGYKLVADARYDEALEEYGKGLDLDQRSFAPLVRSAYVYYLTQNYEDAAEWFLKGLEVNPDDARTRRNYEACLQLAQADDEDLIVMMDELVVEDLAAPSELDDADDYEEDDEEAYDDDLYIIEED